MESEHPSPSDLLPFGSAQTAADGLSPGVRRVGLRIYRQAWDAYQDAGCPYGETDEAMLVWYSFQGEDAPSYPSIGKN